MLEISLKRLFDIVGSLVLLALSWPLFIVALVCTFLDGHRNPFFAQTRIGQHCREFTIYKFRTLKTLPQGEVPVHVKPDDQHLSVFSNFLRKTGMDELPQFINVLKGDMSLIGPRPHALEYARHYALAHPDYYRRYDVKPGLACIVEVTALHYMTETPRHLRMRTNCDLYYVNHHSLLMDIKILYKIARHVGKQVISCFKPALQTTDNMPGVVVPHLTH